MPMSLMRDYPELPYNELLPRFHSKYWTVDYNAEMVGVILPVNDTSFRVTAQWRTNKDFLGVRWQSRDVYSHDCFAYATAVDYSDTILAFRANPSEPNKFTCTVSDFDIGRTYRLAPYIFNYVGGYWECLQPQYGTGRIYPASVMKPQADWTEIPEEAMEPWLGRTDYIFILDFNDLRTNANYSGDRVSPRNVSQISFDTVEVTSGLGHDADIIEMVQHSATEIRIEIGYTQPGVKLTPGDQLQFTYIVWNGGFYTYEGLAVVKSWTGFATGQISVIANGVMPGAFYRCDALYTRFLQTVSPTAVMDTDKYFYDMTVTGNRTQIGLRNYVQPEHSLMMTSGFDDNYPQTPERQIEMVHKLGYRGFWNVYIGMSHYFSAHTGWRDAVTGDFIVMDPLQTMTTVYCGDDQALSAFNIGLRGERGVDQYIAQAADNYDVTKGLVRTVNGAVAGTATERMAAKDPTILDFYSGGGLWWWDLEADAPGPALKWAMANVGNRVKPATLIWAIGEQDTYAIVNHQERVPAPSVSRLKLATQKIFDFLRERWGETLLVEIQQTGWSWDVGADSLPISIAMYPYAASSHWGDVRCSWLSYKVDPAEMTYAVEILAVADDSIVRIILVSGERIIEGLICADYPVEMSVLDFGFPPTFLRWRVRTIETDVVSPIIEQPLEEDNAWFVKRVVMFGGQSNATGHFTALSGDGARKDLVSAGELRRDVATRLGLSPIEVMPIDVSLGSSAAEKLAAEGGGDNYWWDLDGSQPGPRLNDLMATMTTIGVKPTEMIWSQGEADATATQEGSGLVTSPARYKAATKAIFNYIRTQLAVPALPIYVQMITRSYWGLRDPLGVGYWQVRETMIDVVNEEANTRIGSWVIGGETIDGYVPEVTNIGRIHYISSVYHRAAQDLAESIATVHDRIAEKPDWMRLVPMTGAAATRGIGVQDVTFSWNAPVAPGVNTDLFNIDVTNSAVLHRETISGTSYVFTEAAQVAAYGFPASSFYYNVAPMLSNGQIGPAIEVVLNVPYWESPPGPSNLIATRQPNNDIVFSWDVVPGLLYHYSNLNVSTGSTIAQGDITTGSYTFTVAAQVAAYGFQVSYVNFKVQVNTSGTLGPASTYNGSI